MVQNVGWSPKKFEEYYESGKKMPQEGIKRDVIEKIIKDAYPHIPNLSEWLRACQKNLETPQKTHLTAPSEFRKIWNAAIRFLTNFIDTFLIAFSLFDVGKDPQSAWEASSMLDIYYKFFMLPTVVVLLIKLLLPLAELQVYAVAAGVVFLLMILLTIYVRYFRPCPDVLPHCIANLTKDAKEGKIPPVYGREKEVDELIKLLESNMRPMLVGQSGVGKNKIVEELARRIALGEVPNCLKGKKLFQVNTASIAGGGFFGYADQMKVLLSRIGNLSQVILFFDEIQAAEKKGGAFADFLKPVLDRPDLMCLSATTDVEFKEHFEKDPAMKRRFIEVPVDSMKTKALTELLLRHQKTSPFIFTKKEVIEHLVQEVEANFAEKPEPGFAIPIINLCVAQVDKFFDENWERKEIKAKFIETEDVESVLPKQAADEAKPDLTETLKIRKLFAKYKATALKRRKKFGELYSKIEAVLKKPNESQEVKLFLEIQYQIPAMEKELLKIQAELEGFGIDLTPTVTKEVVDSVLASLKK